MLSERENHAALKKKMFRHQMYWPKYRQAFHPPVISCGPLHPGPVNRGVEIDSEIADSARSLILEQVTNGIAVRMAVMFLVSGGKGPQEITGG